MKPFSFLVRRWIVFSATLCASGWALAAIHQLNAIGYAVVLVLAFAGVFLWHRAARGHSRLIWAGTTRTLQRRFRRPLPLLFLLILIAALVGGILYLPSNYDAMSYRLPRVLHWLSEAQWHWIHTANSRMNTRACNFEWLTAPLLALSGSDRGFFLANFVSFLLLPGLIFSVLTRLGVRRRAAWHWMWVVPTGYGFVLGAASVGNDSFAAVYALASVDFALRARESRRIGDFWLSLLSVALLTGSKATNLPLALPWLVASLPAWTLALRRPAATLGVIVVAALASFLPTAVLNQIHCGDWSGLILEPKLGAKHPWIGAIGNPALLVWQNFAPPLFPSASVWNAAVPRHMPPALFDAMAASFENGFWMWGEMPMEESAGLGFGVSMLLLISLVMVIAQRNRQAAYVSFWSRFEPGPWGRAWRVCLWAAPFIAFVAYSTQSGLAAVSRVALPYYPLMIAPLLLAQGQASLARRTWWRRLSVAAGGLALALLVITPPRPLLPVRQLLSALQARHPETRPLQRAQAVYEVYSERGDALAPVRTLLPADAREVGFIGSPDDIETAMWRPYGRRRVHQVLASDPAQSLRQRKLQYVVINEMALREVWHMSIRKWLEDNCAEVVAHTNFAVRVSHGAVEWYVTRLDPLQPAIR